MDFDRPTILTAMVNQGDPLTFILFRIFINFMVHLDYCTLLMNIYSH